MPLRGTLKEIALYPEGRGGDSAIGTGAHVYQMQVQNLIKLFLNFLSVKSTSIYAS